MNKVKHTIQLTTLAATIILLVGCGSGGAFEGETASSNNQNTGGSNQVTVNPEARVYELTIETGNREIYSSLQYQVSGKYDDGSEQDITSLVKFEVTNNIVSFDDEGVALPNTLGTTEVTATLNGVTSAPVTLDVVPTLVCGHTTGKLLDKNPGGGVDDDSRSSASGECLKIREVLDSTDLKRKWFTSTPSLEFMHQLGYGIEDFPTNSGDSYAQSEREVSINGTDFAAFRQDGDGATPPSQTNSTTIDAGKDGQAYRWCQKLNEIEFAGKVGWHIPTWTELDHMNKYNAASGSMFIRFGWPVNRSYQSWQSFSNQFETVKLLDPSLFPLQKATADEAKYVSCVVDL